MATREVEADRKKKVELIPGQAKIIRYLKIMQPAHNLPGNQNPEPGNKNKGVTNDSLLGDTGQGSTQTPSSGGTHPLSVVRGGRGEPEGRKRTKKVLEKWPFLVEQTSDLDAGNTGTQRGKGAARKPEEDRKSKIGTPRAKPSKKK